MHGSDVGDDVLFLNCEIHIPLFRSLGFRGGGGLRAGECQNDLYA